MAQPVSDLQDTLESRSFMDAANDELSDDILNAALLFLEAQETSSDSDSSSNQTPTTFAELDPHDPVLVSVGSHTPALVSDDASSEEGSTRRNFGDRGATIYRRPNKQREEMNLLREEAEALQARLKAMNKQPLASLGHRGPFMIAPLGSTWQDTATHEREQREEAERENQHLRELLRESERIAKALRRIATRETNAKVWEPLRRAPALPRAPVDKGIALQDPSVFDVLIASLGPMLWQTDSMIAAGLSRDLSTERHGDSHLTIKMQDSRIVPVGVARTAAVMWNHSLLQDDLKELRWNPIDQDTFQSQFIAYSSFSSFEGHALGKLVARRVVERDRIVILRHSLFQCLSSTHSNRFVSMPMRHFLWTVIDRPPNVPSIPGDDSISRIRTCAVSLPRLDVGDLNDPTRIPEINALVEMCIDIATQECDHSYDVVDNMLLGRVSEVDNESWPSPSAAPFTRGQAQVFSPLHHLGTPAQLKATLTTTRAMAHQPNHGGRSLDDLIPHSQSGEFGDELLRAASMFLGDPDIHTDSDRIVVDRPPEFRTGPGHDMISRIRRLGTTIGTSAVGQDSPFSTSLLAAHLEAPHLTASSTMATSGWGSKDALVDSRSFMDAADDGLNDDILSAALLFLEAQETESDTSDSSSNQTPTTCAELDTHGLGFASVGCHTPALVSDDASSEEGSPRKNIGGRRRPNKQRAEIHLLRAEAEALQARLDAMNKQRLASFGHRGPFMIAPLGSTWQDTATHGREQREGAERENQRLRELLRESKRIAKALRRIATRETNAKVWEPLRRAPALPRAPVDKGIALHDPSVFDVLIASLGPMLWQTDSMIAAGLSRDLSTERHGDSHLTIKMQDSRIVPVGVARTAAVMWNHSLLQDDLKELRWNPIDQDTFQSQFIAYSSFSSFEGHALGKLVARRVVERDRIVILRHSLFQCLSSTHPNRFSSVPMRHFLWTVVDRPPNVPSIPGDDSISRIRTCAVSMPRLDVGDLNDPARTPEINALVEMCINIATHQCDHSHDVVDNMLLGRVSEVDNESWPSPSAAPFTRGQAQGAYWPEHDAERHLIVNGEEESHQ